MTLRISVSQNLVLLVCRYKDEIDFISQDQIVKVVVYSGHLLEYRRIIDT